MVTKIKEWWNAPLEKKSLKDLVLSKDTLRFMTYVFGSSFIVMGAFLLTQMFAENETEDIVAGIGVSITILLGVWQSLSNMRMLREVWEMIAYGIVSIVLGYVVFQFAIWFFIAFIIYLVLYLFGVAGFNPVKLMFPEPGEAPEPEPQDEAPDYGTVHSGISGDYISGSNGKSLRITDDLGGGDVRTEDGSRYNVDASGHARKV